MNVPKPRTVPVASLRMYDHRALACFQDQSSGQALAAAVSEFVYRPQAGSDLRPWALAVNPPKLALDVGSIIQKFFDSVKCQQTTTKGDTPINTSSILCASPICDCVCLDKVSGAVNYKTRLAFMNIHNIQNIVLTPAQTHLCQSRKDIYTFSCYTQAPVTICNTILADKKNQAFINTATEENIIVCGPGAVDDGSGGVHWTMADIIMLSICSAVVVVGLSVWAWRRRHRSGSSVQLS